MEFVKEVFRQAAIGLWVWFCVGSFFMCAILPPFAAAILYDRELISGWAVLPVTMLGCALLFGVWMAVAYVRMGDEG